MPKRIRHDDSIPLSPLARARRDGYRREQAIVGEHFAHLKALTEQGVMLLVGRTQDNSPRTFGIAIFQAESDEQALELMKSDPAVRKGIMRAELFPFRIALAGNMQGD